MDNQHQKITGYRDLSQAEIDLMNKIKAAGAQLDQLTQEVAGHINRQRRVATGDSLKHTGPELAALHVEMERIDAAQPARWVSIARTDFQTGLMALTRAVAQPGSF
jgi:hypothetical protein